MDPSLPMKREAAVSSSICPSVSQRPFQTYRVGGVYAIAVRKETSFRLAEVVATSSLVA